MQRAPLALSLIALSLAAWAAFRPLPEPPAASCTCDPSATDAELSRLRKTVARLDAADGLRGELTEIRSRINGLKAALSRPAPTLGLAGPGAPGIAPPPAPVGVPVAPTSAAAPSKMYKGFEAPEFLTVYEEAPGQIRVVNRDPAKTGKVFTIPAMNADGVEVQLTVTAPPPE